MPEVTITKRWMESVRVAERTDFFDSELKTFGVRVSPTGTKTWFVLYTLKGEPRKRRLRIGPWPAFDIEKARTAAMKAIVTVNEGGDPKLIADVGGITFGELAVLYLSRYARPNKRSWKKDQAIIENDLLPRWRTRAAGAIRRREVVDLLDSIVDRGAPMQANYARSVLSGIFRFGISRELVETNPVIGTERPHDPERRDRVLSDEEIRAFWKRTAGLHSSVRDALRSILLSGQRPGEVAGLVRSELSEEAWTIPVARAKRGKEHVVPLVGMFAEIVRMGGDPSVFPSSDYRHRGRPIQRQTLSYSLLHWRREQGWPATTPHDLRRTAATGMARLGVARFTIARVIGHSDREVTAIYDRWGYFAEKRAALELWDAHVRDLVSRPSAASGST
jgi:integrase